MAGDQPLGIRFGPSLEVLEEQLARVDSVSGRSLLLAEFPRKCLRRLVGGHSKGGVAHQGAGFLRAKFSSCPYSQSLEPRPQPDRGLGHEVSQLHDGHVPSRLSLA